MASSDSSPDDDLPFPPDADPAESTPQGGATPDNPARTDERIDDWRHTIQRLREQTSKVVVGQEDAQELLLIALMVEGHVLLEGVPGVAKTLLARTFARGLSLEFGRIQFTPDLMPGDVLGTNLFNFQTNMFALTKGPIFTEVLLADEINRTPPKTQAALLEAMQERSVTIDGQTHHLSAGFFVIATQNPIEQEGTYPLPEAQLDRFLFKVEVGYPSRDQERTLLDLHGNRNSRVQLDDFELEPVATVNAIHAARKALLELEMSSPLLDYIVDLVRATREHPALLCGASPRATQQLASASRAVAYLDNRDYVIPDDVQRLLAPTLQHRMILAPGAEIDGSTPDRILQEILEKVPAPR